MENENWTMTREEFLKIMRPIITEEEWNKANEATREAMESLKKHKQRLEENPLLELKDICEKLQISRSTALRMCQQRKIPAHKWGGKWHIYKDRLESWMRGDITD